MLIGDNPALKGGLARSGRDIATLLASLPQFRVAYLGRGLGQKRMFPFVLYDYPESGGWGESWIEYAWKDFSYGEEGVILTTDDLSRRHWFSHPVGLPEGLREFLGNNRTFRKWAYVPLDSTGPNGRDLASAGRDCLQGFDRVAGASAWSKKVFQDSGRDDADWIPHGIWPENFRIIPDARDQVGWRRDEIHVGAVVANQERKDFPTIFQVFKDLEEEYGEKFRGWLHTDVPIRHWNIWALAVDYGVERTDITFDMTDDQLATYYSACHATLLPSGGEGFGFPIAESMACGTACVVTDYAGGAELAMPECRVAPTGYRVETPHNVLRAINCPAAFRELIIRQIEEKEQDWEERGRFIAMHTAGLHWPLLKHRWINWLEKGL